MSVVFQSILLEEVIVAQFTIKKSEIVELLVSLGFKLAKKWNGEKILAKIKEQFPVLDKDTECSNPALLAKLLKALDKDVEIVLDESEGEEAQEEAQEEKPAKKPAKKAKKEEKVEEEEEEADEQEDESEEEEEEEAKPAKGSKKKAKKPLPSDKAAKNKKAVEKKGPGVIDHIIGCLKKATEKKPASKSDILAYVVDKLPDRDADKMQKTIAVQVPGRLIAQKGLDVQKNDKGFWIPKA